MVFCFLNVYKPRGITSFDVIYKLKKRFGIKKIGHSGTLDPLADGVLQIGMGNAAKLLEYLDSNKEYIADVKFGFNSTTLDSEGEITSAPPPDFTENQLKAALACFTGEISQTPPKFSAIKINGKKLCDIARKNPQQEIQIPERQVFIFKIELLNFSNYTAKIKICCSKGTYIRTLGADLAKKLGTGGYLTALTRTRAGNFKIENARKIDEIQLQKDGIEPARVLPLQKYELNENEFNATKNGAPFIPQTPVTVDKNPIMLLYNKKLVSIGVLSDNKIKIKKFFN